ncbi:MAG: hypothetical protein RL291_870, partial [Pseudomonadota bacterium]
MIEKRVVRGMQALRPIARRLVVFLAG